MDALLYYQDPVPAPWYQCCGCARTELPISGCQCVCHETRQEFDDEEIMKMTLLDYLRSFGLWAPIPSEVMTVGELVETLEARARSAEEAERALRMLEPLLDKEVAETEKIQRLSIAINALNTILRLLESAGAQRP